MIGKTLGPYKIIELLGASDGSCSRVTGIAVCSNRRGDP